MAALALQILYDASHDGVSDFAGLGALIPLLVFCGLGVVNLTLFIIYLVMLSKKKLPKNKLVFGLVLVNALLAAFHRTLIDWVSSGPG